MDSDCSAGEKCIEGTCGPTCSVDADCAEGERCEAGACVLLGPEDCRLQGEKSACGTDVGACVAGYRLCDGARWSPCQGSVSPSAETCDGLDHDCDGVPNNRDGGCACTSGQTRPCFNHPPPDGGAASCTPGTQSCVDGTWGACQGAVEPQPGACGQASCAGGPNPGCGCVVGQTQPCYSGALATQGVGACHGGTATCLAVDGGSTWSTCSGEQLPEAERCDGLDHDCDGAPANPTGGCACVLGQSQSCYTGPAGTSGVGLCHPGSQSCVLDPSGTAVWGACTGDLAPKPGQCSAASCTGAQDPNPGCACISGQSQGCYQGPAGTQNVGACHGGMQSCNAGTWTSCSGDVQPKSLDECVPPGTAYPGNEAKDLDCNGTLSRHDPVAVPTATAPSATVLGPDAGYAYAIEVRPLATVTFHGAANDSDGPGTFGYQWRLLSAPTANIAGLSGAPGGTPNDISTQNNPTLFAQLAGDYVVGVRAADTSGCQSPEEKVLVKVKPHSALHLQLTWDKSVDVDLQLAQGSTSTLFQAGACYWGDLSPTWGTLSPSLDIDDVAGCNPENINYGTIGGAPPLPGSTFTVFAHYYCGRRGHRPDSANPAAVCYEPTSVTGPVNATLRVFVDGQLATLSDGVTPAEFSQALSQWDFWKPVTLLYDASGVWRVQPVSGGTLGQATTNCDTATQASCVCSMLGNAADPYCGSTGAACRQKYP